MRMTCYAQAADGLMGHGVNEYQAREDLKRKQKEMKRIVRDEGGHTANISTYDVYQSNGVIHVLDRVVLPN